MFKRIKSNINSVFDKLANNAKSKRDDRRNARLERINARQSGRTDRASVRAEEKTERAKAKYESHEVAYENGIDPKASMFKAVESVGDNIEGIVRGAQNQNMSPGQIGAQSLGMNPILIIGAFAILIFITKKK